MTSNPITDLMPACYGVACPQHSQCTRYAAVEMTLEDHTIGTCDEHGRGERPLFVALLLAEAAA